MSSGPGSRGSKCFSLDHPPSRGAITYLRRRHRVFAELLEQGTRTTLKIPSAYPPPAPSAAAVAAQALEASQIGLDAMRVLGLNPNQALQHPGFYYYMAARCTERRRERFMLASEDGEGQQASSPGFVNEKKVDHLTIVLEVRFPFLHSVFGELDVFVS